MGALGVMGETVPITHFPDISNTNPDMFFVIFQDHYDFGMRAVKTVISAAGNLKRENSDMSEVRNFLEWLSLDNLPFPSPVCHH